MITKGALEGVLDVCTPVESPQGIVPLDAGALLSKNCMPTGPAKATG